MTSREPSKIWYNGRTQPYKIGSGSFKNAFQAEYTHSAIGFDPDQVGKLLPGVYPTQIAPMCVVLEIRLEPTRQTDFNMASIVKEFELQNDFVAPGYALPILGLITTTSTSVVDEVYGIDNITLAIDTKLYAGLYTQGSVEVCYVLMIKCGFKENGQVLSLFDYPPGDKTTIVDSVIDFITYIVEVKSFLFFDFKGANLCRSPDTSRGYKVVGLDFDPKFCIYIPNPSPRGQSIMKTYMFLLFACLEYDKHKRDARIVAALKRGFTAFDIENNLDIIVSNDKMKFLLNHYLSDNPRLPITPLELRDHIRTTYVDPITKSVSGGRKKTRRITRKHKKTRRRRNKK